MSRNPCIGWANGDPVTYTDRHGQEVARGRVIVRRRQSDRRPYLKVELQTAGTHLGKLGEWVWPEGWVIGQGQYQSRCYECRQPYRTNSIEEAQEEFCQGCQRKEARERKAAGPAIRNHTAYLIGARDPRPKAQPLTEEDRADIAAVKEQDKHESPFG